MAVPGCERGKPVTRRDVSRLLAFFNLPVMRADLRDVPAVLTPPICGRHRLYLDERVGPDVALALYIQLHETGPVATGDADQPTVLQFTGPLPEAEE